MKTIALSIYLNPYLLFKRNSREQISTQVLLCLSVNSDIVISVMSEFFFGQEA